MAAVGRYADDPGVDSLLSEQESVSTPSEPLDSSLDEELTSGLDDDLITYNPRPTSSSGARISSSTSHNPSRRRSIGTRYNLLPFLQ